MKINLKKVLLTGTAVVAMGAMTVPGQAQAQNFTLGSDAIWASSAGATGADVANATEGQSVDVNSFGLTITDGALLAVDGGGASSVPADGGTAGLFSIGAVTDSGTGDFLVLQSAGELNATVTSVTVGDDFRIDNVDAANALVGVTVTGAATVGDDLNVINVEADNAAGDIFLTVGGALSVSGATQITAGGGNGSVSFVSVAGNATFGETVTIDGGGAGNDVATLQLSGATNTFTGNVVLDDNAANAELGFSGLTAQTVTGEINGEGAGEGILYISNSAGVTFADQIGGTNALATVNVFSTDGANSAATFGGNMTFTNMVIGNGGGTDTNTVTFSSSGTQTITGAVDGDGGAADVAVVNVAGGGTVTQAGQWGNTNAIDLIAISGNSTLDSNQTLGFTSATIASGSTLDVGANAATGNIINSGGTVLLSAGGGVVGNISGTGTVDVNATSAINGNIAATTMTVAEAADLTITGAAGRTVTTNVTLEDAAFDGTDATLNFANGGATTTTFTGNITTQIDDEGEILFADQAGATLAIVGDIGTSTAQVGAFTVAGAVNANTVTSTGNVYVNAITQGAADTFALIGTSAQTVSGVVTGGIVNVGTAGGATSDVTFSSNLTTIASSRIFDGASATFAGDMLTTGTDVGITTLVNDGTMIINPGVDVVVTNYTADADAGTFQFVLDSTGGVTTMGKLTQTAAAGLDLTNDNIVFAVDANSGTITPGTIAFASAANGQAITFTSANISDTSFLYNFDVAIGSGTDTASVVITATDLATATTTGNNQTVANLILNDPTLAASTDANLLALIGSIQSAPTQEAFNDALEQAQPTVDGSSVASAMNIVNGSFAIVGDRLASVRTGDAVTGMTTGNMTQGVRAWLQGFGATGEQDNRDGIDGYDFDTYGVAVGLDTDNIAEDTVLGVAFSYADTEADSSNAARTNTNTDSYQFTVYGEHDLDARTYLNGMVAYAHNESDTSRTVVAAQANGEFDADVFTIRAELGRDYDYESATLTPHVLGHWTHYDADSYTETGAGGAGLVVDQDALNILELGVGLDVSWLFQNADGSYFSPEISVGYRYDLAGDEVDMTSRFVAGGAAFSTEGFDPQRSTVNGGVGFTYFSTENWEMTAEYDYEWKEDFDSHAGMARAAYRF